MTSMAVARQGYDGFQRNKRVVITGFSNKALIVVTRLTPRRALLKIVRTLQGPA